MTKKETQILLDIEENENESVCLDDFAGNNSQVPCWVDIYATSNNNFYIIGNTGSQFQYKELPKSRYILQITKNEYVKLKKASKTTNFDYVYFKNK